jgi:hypothetical protein
MHSVYFILYSYIRNMPVSPISPGSPGSPGSPLIPFEGWLLPSDRSDNDDYMQEIIDAIIARNGRIDANAGHTARMNARTAARARPSLRRRIPGGSRYKSKKYKGKNTLKTRKCNRRSRRNRRSRNHKLHH